MDIFPYQNLLIKLLSSVLCSCNHFSKPPAIVELHEALCSSLRFKLVLKVILLKLMSLI